MGSIGIKWDQLGSSLLLHANKRYVAGLFSHRCKVYILSDNLGWGNVGYHRARSPAGPSPEVVTPNIDHLVHAKAAFVPMRELPLLFARLLDYTGGNGCRVGPDRRRA